ncbi:MAG TPA: lamin tail domain-containing protein, partial [Chitinophagaceae bacterium]|nr:lamin tail domain-containing protein [Chitinophagaceae bacterium]
MKTKFTRVLILLIVLTLALPDRSQGQFFGRVMINEYMPWPGNACGTTSEFVELFNMGPGPVNIGCYVLTDGDFAVTIPPGTVIYPGDYYVIAGQSLLIAPCANFTKNV